MKRHPTADVDVTVALLIRVVDDLSQLEELRPRPGRMDDMDDLRDLAIGLVEVAAMVEEGTMKRPRLRR